MIKKARLKVFIFFLVFLLIYVPCVQAVTPQCIQPPDAIAPAEFNPDTGYCETYPISSNGTCPGNYVYSDMAGKCVSMPYCEGDYSYNFSTRQCEKISYTSPSSGEGFYLQEGVHYCAIDSNGNGDIEQNEIDECIQTEQGYICPYSMTECSKEYQTPSCPAGYTYNPSTQKCEAGTVFSCPSGSTYDSNLNLCITDFIQQTVWVCRGYVYWHFWGGSWRKSNLSANPDSWSNWVHYLKKTDRFYFNSQCVITGRHRGCFPIPVYPGGRSKDHCSNDRRRGEAYLYNTSYTTTVNTCPSGFVYDSSLGKCTASPGLSCPEGGTYNSSTGKCEAEPVCETGTLQSEGCFAGYFCPLGNYQCQYVSSQGKWMCSPNKCFTAADIQNDEPDTIPNGYQDDGEVSEDGSCLGSIFIFNGYEMRCRPAGIQTGFQNCCDEAQGKIYDNTGSLTGSFKTVKNVIAAISASKQVAQLGYYATKIASGEYVFRATGTGISELVDTATGKVVTTYATNSAEAVALGQVNTGMSADVAVQTAGTTYISQLKTDIALTIVNLAVSQVIDDPLVAATVNFAATLAVPYLFGATINPVGLGFAAVNLALSFFGGGCDEQDILTSTYKESGYCHYVGSKCIKKLPLVGCVQKAKVYCCFNSKLARIIHEQGRPQLANFQGNLWGSAKHPICRGFTPEEFQALDFSKMDLSEYYADIERNVTENLQQKVTTQINETYEGLR